MCISACLLKNTSHQIDFYPDFFVIILLITILNSFSSRALCRIKLLPVTHVLVDTWMLTVKPVYKLLNVSDDLKLTTNTHVTPFSLTFKAYLTIYMVFEDLVFFCSFTFLPVHP